MLVSKFISSQVMVKASMAILAFYTLIASALTIPFTPVPFTMQTLAVTLVGILLGPYLGTFVTIIWIIAGLSGLHAYTLSHHGFDQLFDPTMGYLLSFPIIAFVAGKLEKSRSYAQTFATFLFVHFLSLSIGAMWLAMHIGLEDALTHGFLPFVLSAIFKSLLGTLILYTCFRTIR